MRRMSRLALMPLLAIAFGLAACDDNNMDEPPPPPPAPTPVPPPAPGFAGAVYVGTNQVNDDNAVAAFGLDENGLLAAINQFTTDGVGGVFDGTNDGLDPLISEDSVVAVDDRYVLMVNAGSNTISSFEILENFELDFVGSWPTGGMGPNSIAYNNGLVYVSNVDTDGAFVGAPDQIGNITGFELDLMSGVLIPIAGSIRQLGNRPSNVEFSPDGSHLIVSSWNAGSTLLASGSDDELVSYGVLDDGSLTVNPAGATASTLPGNAEGRNLPAAIGIEVVDLDGRTIVIATEAREFLASGAPAMLPMFQTGSVSTWELNDDGSFTPLSQDVLTGPSVNSGPTSACWIVVSPDQTLFWVSSASGATISSYRLNSDGTIALIDGRAAEGSPADPNAVDPLANADGFIDIAVSGDSRYIYQLFGLQGSIAVYEVGDNGALTLVQQSMGLLRQRNIQGIVLVDGETAE